MFIILTYFNYVTITFFICSIELRFLIKLELRYILVSLNYVWKNLQLRYVFARHSKLRYLWFNVVTFFDKVTITLYFGTLQLRMEIKLQLHFVFARHFDVFFITSQFRYLYVRCSYVF